MDIAFEVCFSRIMKAEGGFVNNPADKGGPTKYGVTLKSLANFRQKIQTTDDMAALTETEAKRFYYEVFYRPLRLAEIKNVSIAVLLMDQAINRGPKTATMCAQLSLRSIGQKIEADGAMGDYTISALNRASYKEFGVAYVKTSQEAYAKICQKDPSQLVFLLGWIRRTHELLDQVLI